MISRSTGRSTRRPRGNAQSRTMMPSSRPSPTCDRATSRAFAALLRAPPADPLLIGALVPLLAQKEILGQVVAALTAFGARGAGQLVDALLDPATPDIVRRRLPLVLKTCDSSLARDGLLQALGASSLDVRLRSGLALLALTDKYPELVVPQPVILEAVERELALARPEDDRRVREHIFNLLALAFEREPVRIAALAVRLG